MPDNFERIVVLDTETSGTSNKCQILTIDALFAERKDGIYQPLGEPFHAEVARQPWARIEAEALQVTGIDIDLWKGEGEEEVLGKLITWVSQTAKSTYNMVCGYNVEFDINFLKRMIHRSIQFGGDIKTSKRTWTRMFSYRELDVLQLALWSHVQGYLEAPANFRLETLAKALGVWREGAHDSSVDVLMTLDVLNELNRRVMNAKMAGS